MSQWPTRLEGPLEACVARTEHAWPVLERLHAPTCTPPPARFSSRCPAHAHPTACDDASPMFSRLPGNSRAMCSVHGTHEVRPGMHDRQRMGMQPTLPVLPTSCVNSGLLSTMKLRACNSRAGTSCCACRQRTDCQEFGQGFEVWRPVVGGRRGSSPHKLPVRCMVWASQLAASTTQGYDHGQRSGIFPTLAPCCATIRSMAA